MKAPFLPLDERGRTILPGFKAGGSGFACAAPQVQANQYLRLTQSWPLRRHPLLSAPICPEWPKPPIPAHKSKTPPLGGVSKAGGTGFEPILTDSESVVLPLDEPPLSPAARILTRAHPSEKARALAAPSMLIRGRKKRRERKR